MSGSVAGKSELLNILGDVKAKVQDRLGVVDFPLPQFVILGKQSVGKSRLIEALAGETFNFISGTLGSRRPTVLEFRNVPTATASRWFVRDRATNVWNEHPVSMVMQIVGSSHEELGESVSKEPICVRIESSVCVDMQMVDLPGFRDFALDDRKKHLAQEIERLDEEFMRDPKNVLICVEQCGDASTMATLARCKAIDPQLQRTVLLRNKLDKYYSDLTSGNVSQWVAGMGDLPANLEIFSLTLPWWQDGQPAPKSLVELREDMNNTDLQTMRDKGLDSKGMKTIGFASFQAYMEKKIEHLFVDAITPVLDKLKELKAVNVRAEKSLKVELDETDPHRILSTTRDCGKSFANGLVEVMKGQPHVTSGWMTLEEELQAFHDHHKKTGYTFCMLPSEDFSCFDDYVDYLTNDIKVDTYDIQLNGGAQFKRLMAEVEIFLRFSELSVEIKKRDVIQARGVSMTTLTWRDVIVKLLSNEAHLPLQQRVQYAGERIKWFFEQQKDAALEFMLSIDTHPMGGAYSKDLPKHAKLIKQNQMIKTLVYETYDMTIERQLRYFMELFQSMLTSTFSNPWVFLKGATVDQAVEEGSDVDDTKQRIPREIKSRSGIESQLNTWLQGIPTDSHQIDSAIDKVQSVVLTTYSFIRSQICDQVELFSESFFKLPMLRKLNDDMSNLEMTDANKEHYEQRRERLQSDIISANSALVEVNECLERLQDFKLSREAQRGFD